MERIEDLPLYPKKKKLIYQRYLSKLSWNLSIADTDIDTDTWFKQSLGSIVDQYVRSWLEIPVAGTLDII